MCPGYFNLHARFLRGRCKNTDGSCPFSHKIDRDKVGIDKTKRELKQTQRQRHWKCLFKIYVYTLKYFTIIPFVYGVEGGWSILYKEI